MMKDPLIPARVLFVALALGCLGSLCSAGQDAKITGNARVDHLLAQMTLDEKIAMIHGTAEDASTYQGEAGYLPGIKRLGIPPMRFADGPPGVLTRVPSIAPTSTMGVAATFSREDARLNGSVIGREARSHGVSVVLQPFINIDRDLNYGRGYNTFGEDPFLTGEMGAAEVVGIQHEGVMSQAKHYVGFDTDSSNVFVDEQALHEVYVAPFAAVSKVGVSSIMCSYNKVNGPYSCGNPDTLKKILKGEVGFEGFVTSDWGATHAADFINSGLDVEMPGPLAVPFGGPTFFVNRPKREAPEGGKPERTALSAGGLPEEPPQRGWEGSDDPWPTTDLKKLVASGVVSEDTITRAAGRVLLQMDKFGYLDGKIKLDVTPSDNTEDLKIAEKTAIDAAVLLKNEGGVLPLKAADLAGLAIIGPNGGQTVAVGLTGEKAVGLPELEVGPLAALKKLAGENAHVTYAPADDMEGTVIPAQYLSHFGEPGLERRVWNENAVSIDPEVNFTRAAGTALPANQAIVWSGTLTVPESGKYRIHFQHLGCIGTLRIDDTVVARDWFNWIHGEVIQAGETNIFPTTEGLDNIRATMELSAGPHRIYVEVNPDTSNDPVQVKVSWVTPQQQAENYRTAIEAAKQAKTAVVFVWSRTRPVFGLPGDQEKLIRDVAAVNPNTIVVLNVSQPVALPWLGQVKAVLDMGWTGDLGGWATAKVLLGQANAGGRLPFTWPKRLEDTPANDPAYPERSYKGVGGKTTFSEGILVGYRWFDRKKIEPQFPFGFGLSYTTFAYSEIKTSPATDGGADVSVTIQNTGPVAGDEVAQVYVDKPAHPPAGVQFADSILAGFERIHLESGERKRTVIHVPLRQLQYWSTARNQWLTVAGVRTFWVGGSSRNRRLEGRFVALE
ncbi:MAG: glycoside hydrolase family 3 C-terminal domain-containing protein [Terriglobales bacterium]|jgi:beta-glucosidase